MRVDPLNPRRPTQGLMPRLPEVMRLSLNPKSPHSPSDPQNPARPPHPRTFLSPPSSPFIRIINPGHLLHFSWLLLALQRGSAGPGPWVTQAGAQRLPPCPAVPLNSPSRKLKSLSQRNTFCFGETLQSFAMQHLQSHYRFTKIVHIVDTTRANETFSCNKAWKGDKGAN